MNRKIRTYEDLQEEKLRLEQLLKAQKVLIRHDIDAIKMELEPVQKAIRFVGKLTTRDRSNAILTGLSDVAIDMVIKKGLLARAGWLSRIAIPYLTKNISSHFLAGYRDIILGKLADWFGPRGKAGSNGQADQPLYEEEKEAQ